MSEQSARQHEASLITTDKPNNYLRGESEMYSLISRAELLEWCAIPRDQLVAHPKRRLPLRLCAGHVEMAELMAVELVDEIAAARERGQHLRLIIPCGPSGWYQPFTSLINRRRVEMDHITVFHMDECLDWQGKTLPTAHPYSFRGFMQRNFYDPVDAALQVPLGQRRWPTASTLDDIAAELAAQPADLVYGGWGQDGHVAYNQARRNPFSALSLDDLRCSTVRIQENNADTIIALSQRSLGGAYQLVPPMSITLGMKQILSARKIRLFSDTGAWKQTALRIALFSPPTPEYPITLLQEHPDVQLTATHETADHPVSTHPEWEF
jgi:glucosamine-6-phosphate deaminase